MRLLQRLDMKNGFGFVEFQDERDADDAIRGQPRRRYVPASES